MSAIEWAWLVPWVLQSTALALLGLALPQVFRLHAPRLRLVWYQALLPLVLVLPWLSSVVVPRPGAVTEADSVVLVVTSALAAQTPVVDGWALTAWSVVGLWCVGVLVRSMWLAAGVRRLHAWRVLGTPVDDQALARALVVVPVQVECLASPAVAQPLVWGVRRPIVLVPVSLAERPSVQREAVYVHELLHVSRHDMRWVWTEELLRTALWPVPAVWLIVPALRLAREQVIDAETVSLTRERRAYVDALVWCADAVGPRQAPVVPFFSRHQLLTRVASLMSEVPMSRLRLLTTVGLLVGVCIGASSGLAALAPLPAPQSLVPAVANGPGPLERQAVLPTLDEPAPPRTYRVDPEWPAEAQALGVGVALRVHLVIDANGDVAEVRAIGVRPDDAPADPAHAAALRASREAILAAVRQWRFEPPRAAPMLIPTQVTVGLDREFMDRSRRALDRLAAAAQDDPPVRIGGAIKAPLKVVDVPPVYPQVALEAKVQGVVIVEAIIERTGDVSAARVLRSIPLLDGAALEAVRQWKYEPQPHRLTMTMTINFTLAADDTPR